MTDRRRRLPLLLSPLLLLPLLLAAGCGFLSRTPSRFYSLERVEPKAAPADVRGLPVGIEIVLPPGVDRKEVVVRQADHRLEVRGTEQWSATFEPLVLHTLAFDLAARLPAGLVILPGQAQPAGGMRTIQIVFEELAAGPERQVVLDARWSLRSTGKPDLAGHEHIITAIDSFDSPSIVSGTSTALATLADRLAADLSGAH